MVFQLDRERIGRYMIASETVGAKSKEVVGKLRGWEAQLNVSAEK